MVRCGRFIVGIRLGLCADVAKIRSDGGKGGLKINLPAFMFTDNPDIIKISNLGD